jgi:CubicO group peptidase (beta-lactamase class C family)
MYTPLRLLSGLLFLCCFLSFSCGSDELIIDPEKGYDWPVNTRDYWPTEGWQLGSIEDHGMDPEKMALAEKFAREDGLSRALLVIKDGYLVYEQYYDEGGQEKSTNLWSVTKSFASAIVGVTMDQEYITSTDQLMSELMPDYPEFGKITLQHVLTQTTGLNWSETGPLWVEWIFSDDWVAHALAQGFKSEPGKKFSYSSGNSHFLHGLVYYRTGKTPGMIAQEYLFQPMGIPFSLIEEPITYARWEEFNVPLPQSWRQDPQGIETASFGLFLTARDMAKFGFLFLNKGRWDDRQLISEEWVEVSTRDHETDIGRYSYGYQWWITLVDGQQAFLASGFGGQIIGIVPALDLVVVLKYEAETPAHPVTGSRHDDMYLFELVVRSVNRKG